MNGKGEHALHPTFSAITKHRCSQAAAELLQGNAGCPELSLAKSKERHQHQRVGPVHSGTTAAWKRLSSSCLHLTSTSGVYSHHCLHYNIKQTPSKSESCKLHRQITKAMPTLMLRLFLRQETRGDRKSRGRLEHEGAVKRTKISNATNANSAICRQQSRG